MPGALQLGPPLRRPLSQSWCGGHSAVCPLSVSVCLSRSVSLISVRCGRNCQRLTPCTLKNEPSANSLFTSACYAFLRRFPTGAFGNRWCLHSASRLFRDEAFPRACDVQFVYLLLSTQSLKHIPSNPLLQSLKPFVNTAKPLSVCVV